MEKALRETNLKSMLPMCCACVHTSRCVLVCITGERARITSVAVVDSNRPYVSLPSLPHSFYLSSSVTQQNVSLPRWILANLTDFFPLGSPPCCYWSVALFTPAMAAMAYWVPLARGFIKQLLPLFFYFYFFIIFFFTLLWQRIEYQASPMLYVTF